MNQENSHPDLKKLFINDLKNSSELLKRILSKDKKDYAGWFSDSTFKLQALQGGAKLLGLSSLIELFDTLGKYFKEAVEGVYSQEHLKSVILDLLKIIEELAKASAEKLSESLMQNDNQIIKLINFIKTNPLQKTSDPSMQTEIKPRTTEETSIDAFMFDLFKTEVETQISLLTQKLVDLEHNTQSAELLEELMRAAHSIKGAARVLSLDPLVQLAHAIEDCFAAAQEKKIEMNSDGIDLIFEGIDLLSQIIPFNLPALKEWLKHSKPITDQVAKKIYNYIDVDENKPSEKPKEEKVPKVFSNAKNKLEHSKDRVLRVSAQNLNRLMGLAGESLVESRWLEPLSFSLLKIKKLIDDFSGYQDYFKEVVEGKSSKEKFEHYLSEFQSKVKECHQSLSDRLIDLEMFILRHSSLSDRLYQEVIDSRMRPFNDGVEGFSRVARDLAKHLDKKVRLEILGKSTPVDRDILEKLETPLNHLIRNAIDHGIEPPDERLSKGKPEEGVVKLEAMHRAGMLSIIISDDGKGIDSELVKKTIIEKKLIKSGMVASLTENEILDFLFLPGFSTVKTVNEFSGRGVGLNIVQNMIQEVSGTIKIFSQPDQGTAFHLLLPLTLSVIRALIVEISGEPYAFPLARIERALLLPQEQIEIIENSQYFKYQKKNVGIASAAEILKLQESKKKRPSLLPIIIISDHVNYYGIVVDTFIGEKELVVQEMDGRLGKVPNIAAGSLMEDGSPVLILDTEDLMLSIDTVLSRGRLKKFDSSTYEAGTMQKKKRILVIDDSITVREVESRLLQNKGYEVQSAVNGMDGWNVLRMGEFDLVVTDIDMPRLNGIELVRLIRSDLKLKNMPVMIVSYKEREEDRLLGLEAGANYYLTKSSFHDGTLINAVMDLIGPP